ncbi:hypothetical protein GCM10009610_35000 [Pseudonocardia xinjiangensis]
MPGEVTSGVVHQFGGPELAEDLHRPGVEPARLRLRRRGGVPLDECDVDAVVAQEECSGQPDQPAADDEHSGADACT